MAIFARVCQPRFRLNHFANQTVRLACARSLLQTTTTMSVNLAIISAAVLVPLTVMITYHDVKYRRIPNAFVLGVLVSGLVANTALFGWRGLASSGAGCATALALMFLLRLFGGLGTGDIKLFGAIGALIGIQVVFPTFVIIVLVGGALALISMLVNRTFRQTMPRVWRIFALQGPNGSQTRNQLASVAPQSVPYGVAITLGSVISVANALAIA